jgi:hypothetical protein
MNLSLPARIPWIAAPAALLLAAAVSASVPKTAASSPADAEAAQGTACNVWNHEPLVAFDVTGATLAGPLDESLIVYSDGTVKHFSQSQGISKVTFVPPVQARALAADLLAAGAFTLCDQPLAGSDIPLQTLTVFRGAQNAAAHTFNWWSDDAPYDVPHQILASFIAQLP